ncbi:MAG: folylpolyglutamate synthase/dihydrofolate synthase family protein [Actinomycetota bacterium]
MSFDQAQRYLDSLGVDAMKTKARSIHRIEAMCEVLDHPERSIPAVHITGTNGKSSTARIATSLLAATGLSVGTYTSPHLSSVTERIALSGEPISEAAFGATFERLFPYLRVVEKELDETLSYFEVLTAMFFLWAVETPVDALVVEVGLGGTWDATNVVPAAVAVITNVGLDHTGLLGAERVDIAREKAGIIKANVDVVTGERDPAVLSVIEDAAARSAASVARIERDFSVSDNRVALGGRFVSVRTSSADYEGMFLSLHGRHQAVNAAVALEATSRFLPAQPLDREIVQDGLGNVDAPGRLETVTLEDSGGVRVVFDVAHNPDAMSALVAGLVETLAFERVRFVVGVLADKDYRGMLAEMTRLPCTLVVTAPKSVRAVDPEDLKVAAKELGLDGVVVADVGRAMEGAVGTAREGDIVCVTGSHYVVGEARAQLVDVSGGLGD